MKHEINITKFNIMAFASNVLAFQNGFVTVTDDNLGNLPTRLPENSQFERKF